MHYRLVNLAQMYCVINAAMVAVALPLANEMKATRWGRRALGFVFANSLLVMLATRVVMHLYPSLWSAVVDRMVPGRHTVGSPWLYTGADFAAHVLPFLLCVPWVVHASSPATFIVPPVLFSVYVLAAPIERIYKLRASDRVDARRILAHSLVLYGAAVLAISGARLVFHK